MSVEFPLCGELDISKFKIMVATPCYGGQMTLAYHTSLSVMERIFIRNNIKYETEFIANESLITRARNSLVAKFLAPSNDSTHLLFIDADIGFNPLSILRMVSSNLDVCGMAYPLKNYDFSKIKDEVLREPSIDPTILRKRAVNHVLNLKDSSSTDSDVRIVNGFIEVVHAGTGFLLIKKEALLKMREHYPENYVNDVNGYDNDLVYNTFFDTMVDKETNRYLSEDYAFCKKWRKIGGKVYVDIMSRTTHSGYHAFEGILRESLNPEFRQGLKELEEQLSKDRASEQRSSSSTEEKPFVGNKSKGKGKRVN